ncbi:MAG: DUF1540 domain-containing protein [Lachnospiraceae bacterium]|nr:DUF1540 domain-containing protein [Lachnospiraceae bacterium]
MTRLDCSVVNCTYNKDNSCCKDNIHVGGQGAKVTDQTCCDSFQERRYDGMRNADDIPSKPTAVSCDATNCTHNQACKCHADQIEVCGADACQCDDTRCGTFVCECK